MHVPTDKLVRLSDLDEAWRRRGTVRGCARCGRRGAAARKVVSGPRVVTVRTLPLTTLAYPTRYAFGRQRSRRRRS